MAFWELERQRADAIALVDAQRSWTYGELARLSDSAAAVLGPGRTVGFLCMPSTVDAVALYLGALRSRRHVPLLVQPDVDATLLAALVAHYRPDWLALPDGSEMAGYAVAHRGGGLVVLVRDEPVHAQAPHPDLALLLSTSGSTGSSKLVRLSYEGLASNARAIAQYLALREDDRAITTLPLAYSFGMSILNSHLEVGGSIILTEESLVGRGFWDLARTHGVTSLSGVPATFEMLRRVGLERFQLDRLRMLTQAGGRLRDAMIETFLDLCGRMGLEFFVMYGQTEAGPRISYVPAARLREKVGSIGIAIPGGELRIDADTGELIYRGPNVMLGYAEARGDLALGDQANGELRTGDLARRDEDGFFHLTGRAKRFIKVSGNRVNLDEVESMLSAELQRLVACSGRDDDLVVFVPGESPVEPTRIKQLIQQRYKLFPGHVRSVALDTLPLLPTGKTDYQALRSMSEAQDVRA
ncbi:AMP-binding protein [Lysobacter sp. FW306-1B-D06B]|uniref:AMP-binding protein n=1 Tax=Lysobacter sp. FW306-1B-D06B TaxID=3140250 RepID=UPI003140438B